MMKCATNGGEAMRFFSKDLGLSDDDFKSIRLQFEQIFPVNTIENAYNNFHWGNVKSTEDAVNARNLVADKFSQWVNGGCNYVTAPEAIDLVHKWGFGGQGLDKRQITLYEKKYLENFVKMAKEWRKAEHPDEMRKCLEICLQTPYVKIARFSKWICFIDPNRYGIYDSRVSLALRKIKLNNKRIFPTLGAKSQDRPNADFIGSTSAVAALRMSETYMIYLDLLNAILPNTNLANVADIEMALFMLGMEKKYW